MLADPRRRVLSGEHIRRSGRKERVAGSPTPSALAFISRSAWCSKGSGRTLILGYFSLWLPLLWLMCQSGRVEEGPTTCEHSPSENTPELSALAIFERMGDFKETFSSGREGWRNRYVSQIGLSTGRRLGSE